MPATSKCLNDGDQARMGWAEVLLIRAARQVVLKVYFPRTPKARGEVSSVSHTFESQMAQ